MIEQKVVEHGAVGLKIQQLAGSAVVFIGAHRAVKGQAAAKNPWRSRSPEWQLPSPVPQHNFDKPFEVIGEPYDYGLAGSAFVSIDEERAPQAPVVAATPAAAD